MFIKSLRGKDVKPSTVPLYFEHCFGICVERLKNGFDFETLFSVNFHKAEPQLLAAINTV